MSSSILTIDDLVVVRVVAERLSLTDTWGQDQRAGRVILTMLAERDEQRTRIEKAEAALQKINIIRNSIVSLQTFNFSEHAHPLVAALNEAGVEGKPYPADREYLGSLLEQRDKAQAEANSMREAYTDLTTSIDTALPPLLIRVKRLEAVVEALPRCCEHGCNKVQVSWSYDSAGDAYPTCKEHELHDLGNDVKPSEPVRYAEALATLEKEFTSLGLTTISTRWPIPQDPISPKG